MSAAKPQFPKIELGALERYRVRGGAEPPRLADIDPKDRNGLPLDKAEIEIATAADVAEIDRLQDILYAEAKHAILVVLQGLDTSGKNGTIHKVFGPIDPLGVLATSFKAPTPPELAHDFLWRVHKVVPPVRVIGVFNRSHYEDVLVARVHGLVPHDRLEARYDQINAFERMLHANGVVQLKFMLHVSRDEQKRRLIERLTDPTKNWKFRKDDLEDRQRWDEFTKAYRGILSHTSTTWAPWYIVPADHKKVRDLLVARTIADTLESLELRYPKPDPAIVGITIE